MRLLVLGAGATGGYFGGRLAQAAHLGKADISVDFLVRPRRAEALRSGGLSVASPQGDFTIPVNAVLHTELKPVYDLVLLSCKAWDLESAILSIYPGLKTDTAILPVLNGLAHLDRLDAEFGAQRVLGGCCHIAGHLGRDGVVRQMNDMQRIIFGLRQQNHANHKALLDTLAAAYRATPVNVRLSDDVQQDMWEKFVLLASLAAMACLMRANVGDIMSTDDGESLMRALYAECESAARHAGHAPREAARDATLAMLTERGSRTTPSMLRDLESGGPIEGAHIVGDMRARARAAGGASPLLSVAWAHLQARDARALRERSTVSG